MNNKQGYKQRYYQEHRQEILAKHKLYRDTHPEATSSANPSKRRHTLRRYGMTNADYDALLLSQDGKCAICKTDTPGKGRKFFDVDHNHITGKVRGLLCRVCNKYVGAFENARRHAVEEYLNDRA